MRRSDGANSRSIFCDFVIELTIALKKLTLNLRVPTLGLFFVREPTIGVMVPTLGLLFVREPTLGVMVLTLGLLIFVS